jgi:hypothetical protein
MKCREIQFIIVGGTGFTSRPTSLLLDASKEVGLEVNPEKLSTW